MAHTKFFLIFSFICFELGLASSNNITTQFLRDSQELVSKNSAFKFGFFSPGNSTTRYAGIWYNKNVSGFIRVIWIANRDNPLNDSSGVLRISEDGNLQLLNGQNNTVWSSNVTANSEVNNFVAQLLDTGNLVVLSNASGNIIWQSFDLLTDVFLPGTELSTDENTNTRRQLVSWKSALDPSSGSFTAGMYHSMLPEVFIWHEDRPYWRSGPWNGHVFIGIPAMYYELVVVGGFSVDNNQEGRISLSFSSPMQTFVEYYALTFDGKIVHTVWDDQNGQWLDAWQSINSGCDVYGKCGEFGCCNSNSSQICSCLRGFEAKNYQEWIEGNRSSGCVRRTPLQCGIVGSKEDGFLRLTNMKVPDNSEWLFADDEEHCRSQCLANCSCLTYAFYLGIGCMTWSGSLIDIQEFSSVGDLGVDLFIRLAGSDPELDVEASSRWKMILAISLSLGSFAFVVVMFCSWRCLQGWKWVTSKDRPLVTISDVKLQDLPLLRFVELAAATNNFDNCNKLGQGGFGPVFKGVLEGQEIAVKRLSRASGQGLQEFMNEVDVISKLQHRNLVRLLGCCAEGEEKMLVYEFMSNKSLDAFLFDPILQKLLDWKKRLNIIEGISRGLLYLHRDSRLRIVHRDLKASNILLDENLNAKISDFGMARIFGSNEDQGNTSRVVGTYGYMSPEYAMEGRFSEKSDVYSFGVLLLEIVSGRKNTRFHVDEPFSLIKYAWQLRNDGNCVSLIDPTINDPCFQEEILRCVEMGLLCVQELPEERPPFSTIVSMIDREITDLPQPKEPAFTRSEIFYPRRYPQASEFHQRYSSVNDVSVVSLISGR